MTRLTDKQFAYFATHGYAGPFELGDDYSGPAVAHRLHAALAAHAHLNFAPPSRSHIRGFVRRLLADWRLGTDRRGARRRPAGVARHWYKSAHFFVPEVRDLGLHPAIVGRIKSILGEDLLLWGSQIITKQKNSHRWHADIEHVAWHGATVWIGIDNVGPENTMKVIPGSHRYGFTPQDLVARSGVDLYDDGSILEGLRGLDCHAEVVTLDLAPGQFFIFAGPTWHASHDVSDHLRTAVICQYCPPSSRVLIPHNFEPERLRFEPDQPWVMQVSGQDRLGVNRVVDHRQVVIRG